ncbi:hypothetical protein [Labilibaculum euxinus]
MLRFIVGVFLIIRRRLLLNKEDQEVMSEKENTTEHTEYHREKTTFTKCHCEGA